MIEQMSTMKPKMSSKLSAILAILTNLQGDRTVRVEEQAKADGSKKISC